MIYFAALAVYLWAPFLLMFWLAHTDFWAGRMETVRDANDAALQSLREGADN